MQRIKIPMENFDCAMVIPRRFTSPDVKEIGSANASKMPQNKMMRALSVTLKRKCFSEFIAVIYSSQVTAVACRLVKFDYNEE